MMSTKTQNLISYSIVRIALGIGLIFLSAQTQIPLQPVPITLYSVGVLIISFCYKKTEAMSSMIGFIFLGSLGFPMFAGFKGGIQVLFGPTGGYIFGFLLCIYVVTTLREKFGENDWFHLTIYGMIGTICSFIIGIPQLALFIGFAKAIKVGLLPFIVPGFIKALFTAASIRLLKKHTTWQKQ